MKKKLKDKAFAAAVSREDIRKGIAELGVDETEHIRTCIEAIRASANGWGCDQRLALGANHPADMGRCRRNQRVVDRRLQIRCRP